MRTKTIGILGGLGPVASSRFYEMLNGMCAAGCDQDYPDVLLYSKASVPDRTAHLLGRGESPLPAMVEGLQVLERAGAGVIAIPCATAHHFYDELQACVNVPVLDMLELTAKALKKAKVTRAALLATEGSYASGAFCRALENAGITAIVPAETKALMELIYAIKLGRQPESIANFAEPLFARGAQNVILGCTELSVFANQDARYIDPMRILAQEILCRSRTSLNTLTK